MENKWKAAVISGASTAVLLAGLTGYFEGSRPVPYRDVTGKWTNCEGNTHNVDPLYVMTTNECKIIDEGNRIADAQAVKDYVTVPLTRGEGAAYEDFVHNLGSARFLHSTMLEYLNKGYHKRACAQLLRWVYADGRILPGLVARRNAEYAECTALPFLE